VGRTTFCLRRGIYDPETKLSHLGARDYDPVTGRWISREPLLFRGKSSNLYSYSGNDPVNRFDPDGLWYVDFNWGPGVVTYGAMVNGDGIYFYLGAGRGASGAVTFSAGDPSEALTFGYQTFPGFFGDQVGWSWNGGLFTESGFGFGYSGSVYWVFPPWCPWCSPGGSGGSGDPLLGRPGAGACTPPPKKWL
jgi:RHS repeat-associated protein